MVMCHSKGLIFYKNILSHGPRAMGPTFKKKKKKPFCHESQFSKKNP